MAEIEKIEKQKTINAVFEPTSDGFLNRTNGLFIGLNKVHELLVVNILIFSQLQLGLKMMDFNINLDDFVCGLDEFLAYKSKFDEIKLEYQKMLTISEIVENNKDLIIQRLNIIKSQIESYERAIKIVDNFFFNIFGFEGSALEENKEKAYEIIENFMNNGIILTEFEKKHFTEESEEEYSEYQNKDSSSVLSSFFDKNQDTIIGKLKKCWHNSLIKCIAK